MARTDLGEALQVEAGLMQKLARQLGELASWGLAELRAKHLELYGEEARSKNLPFLRKKLAFRLQERAEGGVGPEAREHLEILMRETLPVRQSKETATSGEPRGRMPRDPRLPAPGTVLTRDLRGVAPGLEALEHGFRYRIVRAVEQGEVRDFMAASRSMGVSDAWVSMLVSLTFLAPELQEGVLRGEIRLEVNQLVQVARRADWREQRALLERLL